MVALRTPATPDEEKKRGMGSRGAVGWAVWVSFGGGGKQQYSVSLLPDTGMRGVMVKMDVRGRAYTNTKCA